MRGRHFGPILYQEEEMKVQRNRGCPQHVLAAEPLLLPVRLPSSAREASVTLEV